MLKNRLAAFAFVGLLGLGACAAEEEPELVEEPVVEEPAVAPVVEPAPVVVDPAAEPIVEEPVVTDTTAM